MEKVDLTQFDKKLSREEIYQQYEARKRMIEEKIMRLELHIDMLEIANTEWRQYIQQISTPVKRKEEEDKYTQMVDEKTGILNLIREGEETIIILKVHKNETELVLQRLEKDDRKEVVTQQRMLTQTANR